MVLHLNPKEMMAVGKTIERDKIKGLEKTGKLCFPVFSFCTKTGTLFFERRKLWNIKNKSSVLNVAGQKKSILCEQRESFHLKSYKQLEKDIGQILIIVN